MGWDGLVAARNVLAKHKVAGSTPVTRSRKSETLCWLADLESAPPEPVVY